jgi:hypothetical protein
LAALPIRTPICLHCSRGWSTKSGLPTRTTSDPRDGNLQALCYLLRSHPDRRSALRGALARLARTHRHTELYTHTGILPNTGFVSEAFRRIGHKLLPDVLDPVCCAPSCAPRSTGRVTATGWSASAKTPGCN